jgi:hypothetical protein
VFAAIDGFEYEIATPHGFEPAAPAIADTTPLDAQAPQDEAHDRL